MAGPYSIFYDPTKDPGERLAPEIREEIAEVAPSTVTDGSITNDKLAEHTIESSKFAAKAVDEPALDDDSVSARTIVALAVGTSALAAGAVTPPKCGTGVVTAVDSAGADLETIEMYCTALEYAAIVSKDPNTTYNVSA